MPFNIFVVASLVLVFIVASLGRKILADSEMLAALCFFADFDILYSVSDYSFILFPRSAWPSNEKSSLVAQVRALLEVLPLNFHPERAHPQEQSPARFSVLVFLWYSGNLGQSQFLWKPIHLRNFLKSWSDHLFSPGKGCPNIGPRFQIFHRTQCPWKVLFFL